MSQTVEMHIIARIRSDFPTKFGIPRQSGLADVPARVVFEPEYRSPEAVRGLDTDYTESVRYYLETKYRGADLSDRKALQKVTQGLMRLGFDFDDIRSVINNYDD